MTGARFTSRWGLILATLGMAIGTGNIWRFPRVVAQNGGGAFVVAWAIFLFAWSIPLLVAEYGLGRASRRGPVGAFTRLVGRGWSWAGGFIVLCTLLIGCYYAVVTGWCLRYLLSCFSGALAGIEPATAEATFLAQASGGSAAVFQVLAVLGCVAVVARGVEGGIEKACKILVPALFVLLVIAAIRALTLPGAGAGLAFLFHVDTSLFADHKLWLEALSQSAWSTGAGWGLMLAYAVYAAGTPREAAQNCVITGIGNNCASLLAACAVIPAVFALAPAAGQDPAALVAESGPASTGLTFLWMPVLLRGMPGGAFFTPLFFVALVAAALSSLISMVELGVRTLEDLGVARRRSVAWIGAFLILGGLPSAMSLDVFANQDWVWGLGLMVSGALCACAVIRMGAARFRSVCLGEEGPPGTWARIWTQLVTVGVPLQFVALMVWWFTQAAGWGDAWSLSNPFSIAHCLLQWGAAAALLMLLNRTLANRASDS